MSGVAPDGRFYDGDSDAAPLKASLYGKKSAAGDTALLVDNDGRLPVVLRLTLSKGSNSNSDPAVFTVEGSTVARPLAISPWLYGGSQLEHRRNNATLTLLASAARTSSTQSTDQVNYNNKGLILIVDVTARSGTTTLTPNLEVIDPIGGDYITIWTAAAAINTADGSQAYLFYPSALADAAELYTEAVDIVIPRDWRLNVTHSDGDSITYSAAAFECG